MKKKIIMGKKSTIIAFILALTVSACLAPTKPSKPTSSKHGLTGLNIIYNAAKPIRKGVAQAVTLTASKIEFHIDGRLVASGLEARNLKTFVPLPPGEHELVYQLTARGLMTLGMKTRGPKHAYRFILAEEQAGTFVYDPVTTQHARFENVKFSKEIIR